jgi:hypothetical protein
MSDSPIRRFSTASPTSHLKREETLINAYEAEEERIINVLSRKLEQVRWPFFPSLLLDVGSDGIVGLAPGGKDSAGECARGRERVARESVEPGDFGPATTGRASRRRARQWQRGHDCRAGAEQTRPDGAERRRHAGSDAKGERAVAYAVGGYRARLRADFEVERYLSGGVVGVAKAGELGECRGSCWGVLMGHGQLGLSVDNLVGLTPVDPFSQPTHRRSTSGVSSPTVTSGYARPATTHAVPIPSHGVPIPRPSSSIRRPLNSASETTTPLSHSPSSMESPFPFSPALSAHAPAGSSVLSNGTQLTTPPSSGSVQSGGVGPPHAVSGVHALTYPSVPPPSLSSSYGSPVVSYLPQRESASPVEPLSRRGSRGCGGGVPAGVESGTGWGNGRSVSRRDSVERGARIAETGTLVPRSRSRADSRGVASSPTTTRPVQVSENVDEER